MNEYETTVILNPDLNLDALEGALDRARDSIKKSGGKILAVEHWGRRRLAYEIKKYGKGFYVHFQYLGANDLVSELERNLRITPSVLRFLTLKTAGRVDPTSREEKEYARPDLAEEAAPGAGQASAETPRTETGSEAAPAQQAAPAQAASPAEEATTEASAE